MTEELLYINNILIELPERNISLTRQINDIGDVKDRQANYSNNIKVPKTGNNVATFERLGIAGTTTKIPYEDVNVKYVVDGIELISDGKLVVKNTTKTFDVIIYDGNISLSDLLGNKELRTLDFSAHNHTLTESIFTSSFSKTSGYIYGLARYYEQAKTTVFPIEFMGVGFYAHTLFDMIFTQDSYVISGDCLTDVDYKSRVVTMARGFERAIDESLNQVLSRDNSSDATITATTIAGGFQKEFVIDTYEVVTMTTHKINLNGSLNIVKGRVPIFFIKVNGFTECVHLIVDSFNQDFEIQVESGDTISITVAVTSDINSEIEFSTEYTTIIWESSLSIPITIEDLIGDTKRKEFIKDIMQHFGWLFRKKAFENEFEFVCIKDILTDKAGADDWSDKDPTFLKENYTPNYAQQNYMRYQYDTDDTTVNQIYGDGIIRINNVNLPLTKDLFTSLFKASTLIDTTYYGLNSWIDSTDDIETNDDGLRMFKVTNVTDTIKFKFKLTSGGSASFTGSVPLLSFVTYQTNINNFYLEFQSLLNSYKKINLSLNLSLLDINNLDFFKLKFFEQLGQYYYLNKVVNFRKGRVTKCELVQIGAEVTPLGLIDGSFAGSSVYSATLSLLPHGDIEGGFSGNSVYSATLKKDVSTSFPMSNTGETEGAVCDLFAFTTKWHDGVGTFPSFGDFVFDDEGQTTPFGGGDLFYKLPIGDYLRINNSGEVIQKSSC